MYCCFLQLRLLLRQALFSTLIRGFVLVLVFATALAVKAQGGNCLQGKVMQAFEQAMKLAGDGKAEAAIEKMHEAISIFPPYFNAHFQLGNNFLKLRRFDEAIAELDRARQIDPNDDRVYQSFGLLLMQQKNYAIAVAIFSEASRLNPGNPLSVLMRATALIHHASTIPPGASLTGLTYSRGPELALLQASKLSSNKLKADSLTLASLYEMKGEPERAADELESYLRKSPGAKNVEIIHDEIDRLRKKARRDNSAPK